MPRPFRTLIPRIRRSLREHGLIVSLFRSLLLPGHLLKEYRAAKAARQHNALSEFDRTYSINTDGEYGGWTYLSDLNIPSQNWAEGNDYAPIEPERLRKILAGLDIAFGEYTFVDFGSGKGRALLLASEFPFRRILGIEFSSELHQIAERNIARYRNPNQKCQNIQSLNLDFVSFDIPQEPLVLFFFDPSRESVMKQVVAGIRQALATSRHPLYVIYVVTRFEQGHIFSSSGFLKESSRNSDLNVLIFERDKIPAL